MVVSKGIAGGFPISALVGREEIMGKLPANIQSTTFEGNPLACAAATATIGYLRKVDAPALSRRLGERIVRLRADLNTDRVAEIRGAGALWGLEIVKLDKAPDPGVAKRIQQEALRQGLVLDLGGRHANVVGIVPPLVVSQEEFEQGLGILQNAIRTAA